MQGTSRGFTLIELSIVLVIIGLIVGGVLAGRDLIHAATLRSVITDIDRFNVAVMAFEGKYNCLPGDCSNATMLFGRYSSGGEDCSYGGTIPRDSGTCNGDGNGKVTLGSHPDYAAYDETTLFWQQLSIAGLVQGTYGGATIYGMGLVPGTNAPVSKVENGCYSINYSQEPPDLQTTPYYPMDAHFFALGNSMATVGAGPSQTTCVAGLQSLMAVDAQSIDGKMDDGRPMVGIVRAPWQLYGGFINTAGNSGCITGNYGDSAALLIYDSATAYTPCELFFKAAF